MERERECQNSVRERQLCSGDVGFVTWRCSSHYVYYLLLQFIEQVYFWKHFCTALSGFRNSFLNLVEHILKLIFTTFIQKLSCMSIVQVAEIYNRNQERRKHIQNGHIKCIISPMRSSEVRKESSWILKHLILLVKIYRLRDRGKGIGHDVHSESIWARKERI